MQDPRTNPNPGLLAFAAAAALAPLLLALAPAATALQPSELPVLGPLLPDNTAAACASNDTYTNDGYIAITHRGSFPARGEAYDGCGGDSSDCDDWIDGDYWSNSAWHSFSIIENGRGSDRCDLYCYIDDLLIDINGDGHGEVTFDYVRHEAYYGCNDPGGAWQFGGTLENVDFQ